MALFVAAAGLHFVPGLPPSVGLALVAAAVLAFMRIDGPARDEITQAYRDVGKG